MNQEDIWLFIEHGRNKTWTRALVPKGIQTIRDLVHYLTRGGRVESPWMEIQPSARFIPRVAGLTVLAQLVE